MKKKMEKLDGELFKNLTVEEGRWTAGQTATTLYETGNPTSDYHLDGEGHN